MRLVYLAVLSICALIAAPAPAANRHNLFDPLFATDDADTHTVSAAGSQRDRPSVASSFPPRRQTTNEQLLPSQEPSFTRPPTRSANLATSTTPTAKRLLVGSVPTSVEQPQEPLTRARKQVEPARHWSALENYYAKLRQSSRPKNPEILYQQQQQQSLLPIYQILQQEADEANFAYRPQASGAKLPLDAQTLSLISNANYATKSQPTNFLLPLNEAPSLSQVSAEPNFKPTSSVYDNPAPGISRAGGIGGSSILLNAPTANRELTIEQIDQLNQLDQQLALKQVQLDHQRQQQLEQQLELRRQQQQPLANVEDGRVKYLEYRKLPELMLIQQQQQRAKHQQETFGAWYDLQRAREMLQEEAFCGPRNYVNFHLVPSALKSATTRSTQLSDPAQLMRLQLQLNGFSAGESSQLDVPVALSAGEFPSHMGVYNGSTPGDDNYLCAATWIQDRYALTLASCVARVEPKRLTIRAGEWNLNRVNGTNKSSLITRQVTRVFTFPKYRNDSSEHNLAIVELSKPIEFLEVPYICPACQMQSRNSIRASSCWTPVRNISLSEYFDPEGEGETRERKSVQMIELPVRLIANDEAECFRQTKVEFFNFHHPNYICSADYRSAEWRVRLNQTDYFGSGVYCNEGGNLNLVSMIHPIHANASSSFGYVDLSYYRPWMKNIVSGRAT